MPKLDVGSGAYSQTARLLDEWANQPDSSIGTTDYHDYYDDDFEDDFDDDFDHDFENDCDDDYDDYYDDQQVGELNLNNPKLNKNSWEGSWQ